MVGPVGADGPKVLLPHRTAQVFQLRDVEAGTRFRVEAVGAAVPGIRPPVVRSHPLIGAFHLHAGRAAQGGEPLGGANVGPVFQLVIHFKVAFFQARVGNAVAAGEPANQGGVVAQAHHLVVEVADGHILGRGVVDAAVAAGFRKAAVVFPLPLAAEAHQGEDALLVAKVVHGVVQAPDVLEADAVEAHIGHQTYLEGQAFRRILHEQVVGPAGGLDEDGTAVEEKLPMPVCVHNALNITDTERHLLAVGDDSVFLKRHVHVVQLRGAHLARPPDAGVLHRFLHGERAFLAGGQGDGKGKAPALVRAAKRSLHGTRGTVINHTINQ